MRKLIILLVTFVIFCSCSSTRTLDVQKLSKGTVITTYKENIASTETVRFHDIYIYKAEKNVDVKIKIEDDKIRFKPLNLKDFKLLDSIKTNIDFDTDSDGLRLADRYAFTKNGLKAEELIKIGKGQFYTDAKELKSNNKFIKTKAIKYTTNKPVFQTLTIPFKIRSEKGGLSSTVSTNFNAGIAYGYQWNKTSLTPIYNSYNKGQVKMAGYDKRTLSFSLSPFLGLTPVTLKASNTNNTITEEKSVLGLSFGGAGVFTINRVNIGLALGFDYGLNDSKNWVYQGELWTGIVLGLDLIK
ncbi:hypothetical protein [Polaribacter sp. Z022]|uniref:hypothetical protein n=1 Tax=Polaribacter sp. Z022 TaxID=2927125 RepID=UPI0020203E48|nr:hypothetical protein [Polaribacter sp. Z022]MCL7753074.1 hypothetical protein [Polaribacter sp. Z022]